MKRILSKINNPILNTVFANIQASYKADTECPKLFCISFDSNNINSKTLSLLATELSKTFDKTKYSYFTFATNNKTIELLNTLVSLNFPDYNTYGSNNHLNIDFNNHFTSPDDKVVIERMAVLLGFKASVIKPSNSYNKEQEFDKWVPNKYNNNNVFKNSNAGYFALTELPRTKQELEDFTFSRVTVEGEIFSIDARETKNGKIMTVVKITNYQESALVRFFTSKPLNLKNHMNIKVAGKIVYDEYLQTICIQGEEKNLELDTMGSYTSELDLEGEDSKLQRVELNVHTNFSTQDGMSHAEDYFKVAKHFGINALTITDNDGVQAFPEVEKLAKKYNITANYGVEMNVINTDEYKIFYNRTNIKDTSKVNFVAVDIETTGFSGIYDRIIEIGAVNLSTGETFDKLIKLDDPERLTDKIIELTGITPKLLETEGEDYEEVMKAFVEFAGDSVLIGHNVTFDAYFIENQYKILFNKTIRYSFVDTLNMSRSLLRDKMKLFGLDKVCKKCGVELETHHRAYCDAKASGGIFTALKKELSTTEGEVGSADLLNYEVRTSSKASKEAMENYLTENNVSYTTDGNKTISFTFAMKNFNPGDFKYKVVSCLKHREFDLNELNELITMEDILNHARGTHYNFIAKNQKGLKAMYKMISLASTERITSRGVAIFESDIVNNKELLDNCFIGTSGNLGMFKTLFEKGFDHIGSMLNVINYIELQSLEAYASVSDSPFKYHHIKDCVLSLYEYSKKNKIPMCYTSNVHYAYPKIGQYRNILVNTLRVGHISHDLKGVDNIGFAGFIKTDDLVKTLKDDYGFIAPTAQKMIFDNPQSLQSQIEPIVIIPNKLFVPSDDFLKDKVLDVVGHKVASIREEFLSILAESLKKYEIDGKLPEYIQNRYDKEVNALLSTGYYIIYYICYLLVKKSNDDGYVVGSRGSVGSSFIANLLHISDVNSLAPHYRCPKCNYQMYKGIKDLFVEEDIFGDLTSKYNDSKLRKNINSVQDGYDLPKAKCPCCGEELIRDGHDIPFETFLGFNGDKVPDIDLNFSGEYQGKAHNFCKEVFGAEYSFRAGTVQTIAEKTAENFTKDYYASIGQKVSDTECSRRSAYITDIKKTTGQHPAGIVVIPEGYEIEDFTPVQYPANDPNNDFKTTHFDYHGALDEVLLKFDILGHDDPTLLKFLMDNVKANPSNYPFDNVNDIPVVDKETYDFLRTNDKGKVNSWGISEFGTNFVQGMLKKTNPQSFAELVKISGLSHGTDVWQTNAEALVEGSTKYGKIPFEQTIGCRDDIMVQLIEYGLEPKMAFDIMEFVRKGKLHKEPETSKEKWEKYQTVMREHKVPEWYIWSLSKIKYMFPKGHAVAYVTSALKIAWFKAHRPMDYYQAYFSIRAEGSMDAHIMSSNDVEKLKAEIERIKKDKNATITEKDRVTFLEVEIEMLERGIKFAAPDVNKSHYSKFIPLDDNTLLMPLSSISGVGLAIAQSVYENRPYNSIEELKEKGKANKTFIEGYQQLNH